MSDAQLLDAPRRDGLSSPAPSTDDDDELQIDEVVFAPSGKVDPADRIRASLDKLVAAAKRRKEARQSQSAPEGGGAGKRNKPSLRPGPVQVIMGWMDQFHEHERIQLACLQSLPIILEDPSSRRAAQIDGLASIVLYDMTAFPNNSLLQLTAFHTLVVLLRPLGSSEGTVHHAVAHGAGASSKSAECGRDAKPEKKGQHAHKHHHKRGSINAHHVRPLLDASFEPRWDENGVRVMLDSLRRFANDRYLQAMGCWALVNAGLYPSLKTSLLRLGGVYAITNAMMLHPNVEAVQFRGLFALINLVIPDAKTKKKDGDGSSIRAHVYQIARLTLVAMHTFNTNKSILNRGCLVLRNLSLTPAYVRILARTPGCADMLLHCRQMCPRDALVQRSARTIMILVQRAIAGGSDSGEEKDTFKLTQPVPVGPSAPVSSNDADLLSTVSGSTPGGGSRAGCSESAS
ncbi:hypothetical protein ACHAXT_012392 [Thalassiosira profunda]